MKRKYVFTALLLCATLWAVAQKKDAVLLTVNSTPVYASEFKKVYKKNLDLVQDESQKDVENYLGLFIDYKLKVAEAYAQKLDEKPAYKKEFSKYQDQLSRKYLYDQKLAAQLAKEAFERGKEQINANHILITINGNETPADTLA
ncbi:MAG: peptidylprolyl isomerase, partial [Marinirhabdus sp.]